MNPIVGIHAFRHGAGTSTLTAYLALMLAQQGRRVAAIEVQCPGLLREPKDLRLPTYLNVSLPPDILPFHLNPPNSYHAVSVPSNPIGLGHIHLMTFSASVTQHWTLESCSQLLAKILQELDVDYLLIDLPPGMNEFSLMMFGIIDTLVVHLCPEQADFQGTAVMESDQPLAATLVQNPQSANVKIAPISNGFSGGTPQTQLATVIKNTFGADRKSTRLNSSHRT